MVGFNFFKKNLCSLFKPIFISEQAISKKKNTSGLKHNGSSTQPRPKTVASVNRRIRSQKIPVQLQGGHARPQTKPITSALKTSNSSKPDITSNSSQPDLQSTPEEMSRQLASAASYSLQAASSSSSLPTAESVNLIDGEQGPSGQSDLPPEQANTETMDTATRKSSSYSDITEFNQHVRKDSWDELPIDKLVVTEMGSESENEDIGSGRATPTSQVGETLRSVKIGNTSTMALVEVNYFGADENLSGFKSLLSFKKN